jgi:3-methyladenine DNA glycosylase AlkD
VLLDLRSELQALSDPAKAKVLQRFFKTAPGEYGEGDVFMGIAVPQLRAISKKYKDLSLSDIRILLYSKVHEERLVALLILVMKYKNEQDKQTIVQFYLDNIRQVNNWDLVDLSAPNILGLHLVQKKDRSLLYKLAASDDLWERRIAILATHSFIRNNDFEDTIQIFKILLHDDNDLIQKALGWTLREIGKRNMSLEEEFLKRHYKKMKRIALRYAIERFPETKKRAYLEGKV